MYKFARWLWRKSEVTTAQSIIQMGRAFYLPPAERQGEEDPVTMRSYQHGMMFLEMIAKRHLDQSPPPRPTSQPSAVENWLHRGENQ